jgi:hypothetical protein
MWAGLCGNGMCQKRGRESLRLPCGGKSESLYIEYRSFLCPPSFDFVFSRKCRYEAAVSPRGRVSFERESAVFLFLVPRLFVGEGITANVRL